MELLVVIAIIAMLVGLVMPALGVAREKVRIAATRAMLHSISVGLDEFRNDHGNYPPSAWRDRLRIDDGPDSSIPDMGGHCLAEAMFGIDKVGYSNSGAPTGMTSGWYYLDTGDGSPMDFTQTYEIRRWGPYVNVTNLEIYPLYDARKDVVFNNTDEEDLWLDENEPNPVILDKFSGDKPRPILYYRANASGHLIHDIYNYDDNYLLTDPFGMESLPNVGDYPEATSGNLKNFEYYIWDHRTPTLNGNAAARPVNADSFILVSAGPDAEYGTEDDVCNFERTK